MDRDGKLKKRGQYPAILTERARSIKDLLYGSILPARVANPSVRFGSSYPLKELASIILSGASIY